MASKFPPSPRDRSGFEIAMICALSLEAECVQNVLDKIYDDKKYGKAPCDDNIYTLGVIGAHQVVIVHMPGQGAVRAACAVANLTASFPNIKLTPMVGVCRGMPFGAGQEEILLGDVVISKALIQHTFRKQYPNGFLRKTDVLDTLGAPSERILAFLARLETRHYMQNLQNNTVTFLQAIQQQSPKVRHPGVENDVLYLSSYTHQHRSPMTCDKCETDGKICESANQMDCDGLGCKSVMRVPRRRLVDSSTTQPMIHIGIMGSGDTVMKSAHHHDALA